MLVILFGLAGSGKNFVGDIFKQHTDAYVWDADELLTDDMKLCIKERRSFSQDIRDTYFALVLKNIAMLYSKHPFLVVLQAFYKNKNRLELLSAYPESVFIQIQAETEVLIERLQRRGNFVDPEYALQMTQNFENPDHPYRIINNNGDKNILKQLYDISELNLANMPQNFIFSPA